MSREGMKVGLNREKTEDHKKLTPMKLGKTQVVAYDASKMMKGKDASVKDHTITQHDNSRMLSEEHSDEKLAITISS